MKERWIIYRHRTYVIIAKEIVHVHAELTLMVIRTNIGLYPYPKLEKSGEAIRLPKGFLLAVRVADP